MVHSKDKEKGTTVGDQHLGQVKVDKGREREDREGKDQQRHATSVARKGTCQKIARPTLSDANTQTAENKDIWRGSAGRQQSGKWATTKKKKKKGHNMWVGEASSR